MCCNYSSCVKYSWQLQATCGNAQWDEVEIERILGANVDVFESGGALTPPYPLLLTPMVYFNEVTLHNDYPQGL